MVMSKSRFLAIGILALTALPAFAGTVDVIFFDNRFGTLNDTSGSYSQIGTLPLSASSGIAWMNNLLYVEDLSGGLLQVDPETGASQLLGSAGLSNLAAVFAGGSNGLFEIDYASNLYSINPLTGAATLRGATGLAANNGNYDTSLSSDGNSLYYTAGRANSHDELYRIDTGTGLATDLGSTGIGSIAGSAFVDGNLELYQYGQSANHIYAAPAGSADFVQGAQLAAQILDGGAVQADPSQTTGNAGVTPEPGSVILFGIGMLLIGLTRRRKVR